LNIERGIDMFEALIACLPDLEKEASGE